MLSFRAFPRCLNHYLKQSQLHTSVILLNANDASSSSSSSSSDSSDSDSDKEAKVEKKQAVDKKEVEKPSDDFVSPEKMNERLNDLLLKISQNSKIQETPKFEAKNKKKGQIPAPQLTPGIIDVAIKHRKIRFQKPESEAAKKPIEQQIAGAAKDVANSLGDVTGKTEAELLGQILNLKPSETTEEKPTETSKKADEKTSLSDLLSGMKVDQPSTTYEDQRKMMAMKVKERLNEKSVAGYLLYKKKSWRQSPQSTTPKIESELNAPIVELNIFNLLPKEESKTVCLSTWNDMEKREMKLATLVTPQNVFQELIQWTEQGKLWHFPVNNEQGLEEEEKVHFSEHVFLEPHIKDWCPKKGPIRNFMELVCIGLSKNPYMTVEEKIGHLTWYRNYFEEKKDLLSELGVLDNKEPPPPAEKQVEA